MKWILKNVIPKKSAVQQSSIPEKKKILNVRSGI